MKNAFTTSLSSTQAENYILALWTLIVGPANKKYCALLSIGLPSSFPGDNSTFTALEWRYRQIQKSTVNKPFQPHPPGQPTCACAGVSTRVLSSFPSLSCWSLQWRTCINTFDWMYVLLEFYCWKTIMQHCSGYFLRTSYNSLHGLQYPPGPP